MEIFQKQGGHFGENLRSRSREPQGDDPSSSSSGGVGLERGFFVPRKRRRPPVAGLGCNTVDQTLVGGDSGDLE